LLKEIEFVDASIGDIVAALKRAGIYGNTLLVVTAKHGASHRSALLRSRRQHHAGDATRQRHPFFSEPPLNTTWIDDTNVVMLIANPSFKTSSVAATTTTTQIAPTIIKGHLIRGIWN
jgi:arylsulfatase A-like enzyme